MRNLLGKSKQLPADFKNPFNKDKVSKISMWTHTRAFKNETIWLAYVDFKNGKTEGTQRFTHKDFATIVKQVEDFVNAL